MEKRLVDCGGRRGGELLEFEEKDRKYEEWKKRKDVGKEVQQSHTSWEDHMLS